METVIAIGNPDVSAQRDPTNIGRALPSGRAWIADPQDANQITPVGCVGELLLDGPFLAREYINNEVKTADSFVTRPSWAKLFDRDSSKMYRTGDLVQYNQDGSLKFIGRKDNQVK
jgi:non-ribosomal peptide synthetase component F